MADDKGQDRQVGNMGIAGQSLRTPRPGHAYNVDMWRVGGTLVLRIYEDPRTEGPILREDEALAEIVVKRGALPRVLDVLQQFDDWLGAVPEVRTRLSNLDPALPEDTGQREPFDGAS